MYANGKVTLDRISGSDVYASGKRAGTDPKRTEAGAWGTLSIGHNANAISTLQRVLAWMEPLTELPGRSQFYLFRRPVENLEEMLESLEITSRAVLA